jgi:hypothetical protein
MHGHLVIADISGYTQFLSTSELEHANGIITELLNSVIGAIQAPLAVSSIEGDAVFMYGQMPDGMRGQTVLESVELLYCSFAAALETMTLNTTCRCNACANINTLGMKIVMHCGEFVKSEIGGRETLSGPDVIMTHRLLKNEVREKTGISDYMLVTDACATELDVEDIVAGWTHHTEEYEHVGEIEAFVASLPDVWAFVRQQNEDKVLQREAWVTVTAHSKAPPAVVWDYLVDPFKRTRWIQATDHKVSNELDGRIGVGSNYHCVHGDDNDVTVFTVLDMRPVDYITFVAGIAEGVAMRYTDYVVPSGSGTRVVTYAAPLFASESGEVLPDEDLDSMKEMLTSQYSSDIERMVAMADETAASLVTV